ncbi:hypothetical protein A2707_02050 [Candidatus Saccharibacteria bacterium RIFCSPHIGHO2_01_FULL_45_15]|nr:MAG: hypothetical protein A2707_02050 [Candidatus Saccharibacteria bacterium RIFCSPHIGHO2_01_FULL_45_15]OGL27579.1 MAG: hypothetical protein A3C39_00430 [Candidatus Saccharibacteria bacterium RIFCSPHIGHO2_02_FULL_46_12]OGL31637.1 MAG: hypothetical protein A3E76_00790 [Candidatus Saccharibacteria bacterium RIFCSPHIGHO2_12_FULL_44_22]
MDPNYQAPLTPPPLPTAPQKQSHKKRTIFISVIVAIFVFIIASTAVVYYLSAIKKDPVVQQQVDSLTQQANLLPEDLKAAITKGLGITPREYLKQSIVADELSNEAKKAESEAPDTFGGAYIDSNGKSVMNFTDMDAAKKYSSAIEKKQVGLNSKRLAENNALTQKWLDSLSAAQRSAITSIDVNSKDNTIQVNILDTPAGKSISKPANLSSNLFKWWPTTGTTTPSPTNPSPTTPAPEAIPADPSTGSASDPANSGVLAGDGYFANVTYQGKKTTLGCSLGFSATGPNGQVVAFTSGHCKEESDKYKGGALFLESKPTEEIGNFGISKYTAPDDYAVITLNSKYAALYKDAGIRTKKSPLYITGTTSPVQGAPACKAGRTSGWTCGRITSASTTFIGAAAYANGTYPRISGFGIDTCARPGDSGGPFVTGTKAVGIGARVMTVRGNCGDKNASQTGGAAYPIETALKQLPGYKLNIR